MVAIKTSLRKQIILFGIITTFLISGLLYYTLYAAIREGFNKLEDTAVDRNVTRINNGIESNFTFLTAKSGDWAHWDQTYEFIDDLNQAYIDENMTDDAFSTLDINLAFYINKVGQRSYYRTYDLKTGEVFSLSEELSNRLLEAAKDIPEELDSSVHGLVTSKDHLPLFIVAQHIIRSDGSGPANGVLIFGRFLDEEVLVGLEKSTIFNIEFYQMDQEDLPEDVITARQNIQNGKRNIYISRKEKDITGYTIFNDFWGSPSLIFRVDSPREIAYQASLTVDYTLYVIVVAGLAYCLFGYVFIKKVVLNRLSALHNEVRDITRNKNPDPNFVIKGDDEIGYLAEKMNTMLIKLATAQATLEKSEKRYKGIVESQQDMVIRLDSNFRFLYVNKIYSQLMHLESDKLIGENFLHNLTKEEAAEFEKEFKHLKRKPYRAYIEQKVVIRRLIHWIGWEFFAITDKNGKIIEIQGEGRDITKLKEIDQLKSEFVSLASHQLRTPLSSIKWFAELLNGNNMGQLNADQKDCLKQIIESNDRMIKLVNDLLNISHIESANKFNIKKAPTNLVKIIRSIIKEQTPLAKAKGLNIIFENNFPENQLVNLDGEKIGEVIQNLLTNAIKYSYNGNEIIINLQKKRANLQLSVKNTGAGIDINQRGHIFEKFFRTESARLINTQGSGLGLYIAKAIVERHNGKIWFTSNKKTTTFIFHVPLG